MDKLVEKIEALIEKYFAALSEKPLKTGLGTVVVYWLLKKIYEDIKR